MRSLILSAVILATISAPVWAQAARSPDARTTSPPPTLAQARTAVVINLTPGPSTDKPFRELRGELRKWDHFKLQSASRGADVIISLAAVPVRTLTVRQGATGTVLWSAADNSVKVMVKRMKQQLPRGPSVCVAFWCW